MNQASERDEVAAARRETKARVKAMTEALKLNADVAVQVMGWLPPEHPDTWAMRKRQRMTHSAYDRYYLTPLGEISQPPRYSEDIAAAMQVLDRFPLYHITRSDHPSVAYAPYRVELFVLMHRHESRHRIFKADAATLEVAICRAALAAVDATHQQEGTLEK